MSDTKIGAGGTRGDGANAENISDHDLSSGIGGAISESKNTRGANKWFGAIAFSPDARLIARQGALAAWIYAVMIIAGMGIAYAGFMNSANEGAITRDMLNEKMIASAFMLLLVLFCSWRIWSGKGFFSAAMLTGVVSFAMIMKMLSSFAGGAGAGIIVWFLLHGVVLVLSVNGMRGAWAYWVYFKRLGAPGDEMKTVPE